MPIYFKGLKTQRSGSSSNSMVLQCNAKRYSKVDIRKYENTFRHCFRRYKISTCLPTWVINPWNLPFPLIVRILDFLLVKTWTLLSFMYNRKGLQVTLLSFQKTPFNLYLAFPRTSVIWVGNERRGPLSTFFIIPILRLQPKKSTAVQK